MKLPINQGKIVLIDEEDYDYYSQHNWSVLKGHNTFYAQANIRKDGKRGHVYLHRYLLNAPIGMWVDHKDGNGLNNTKSNLRLCSGMQNQANRVKDYRDCTSIYKGVYWHKQRQKWYAQIKFIGKHISLGSHNTEQEAALAYNIAATQYFGEFARLNCFQETPC